MAYVKRETGYWKHCMLHYGNLHYEGYSCSICREGFKADQFDVVKFRFCPQCGSKMIEIREPSV